VSAPIDPVVDGRPVLAIADDDRAAIVEALAEILERNFRRRQGQREEHAEERYTAEGMAIPSTGERRT
jgi:hypothetical protein